MKYGPTLTGKKLLKETVKHKYTYFQYSGGVKLESSAPEMEAENPSVIFIRESLSVKLIVSSLKLELLRQTGFYLSEI